MAPTAIATNRGSFTVRRMLEQAPATVANFVERAQGHRAGPTRGTGMKRTDLIHMGTISRRAIDGFMIQGGVRP
jgi:cyclophilin family peptidyl-prolyl cis-trans isomerase